MDVNRLAWFGAQCPVKFPTTDDTKTLDCAAHLLAVVSKMVDEGLIRTTLGSGLGPINAANLKRAHKLIEGGRARGKLVVAGFEA